MYAFFHTSYMGVLHRPIVQEVIIIVAMVVLLVFCIDKSRQNQRTRQALYNCIYPLYGAAVFKTVMLTDSLMGFNLWGHAVGLLLTIMAMLAYWFFFKVQEDIKYNKFFRNIGWLVLAVCAVMQACFVGWTL